MCTYYDVCKYFNNRISIYEATGCSSLLPAVDAKVTCTWCSKKQAGNLANF